MSAMQSLLTSVLCACIVITNVGASSPHGNNVAFTTTRPPSHVKWQPTRKTHNKPVLLFGVSSSDGMVSSSTTDILFSPRDLARKIQPSVALVTPIMVRNMTARGTGFVIDFGKKGDDGTYLLTAAHVAAPGRRLEVTFPAGGDKGDDDDVAPTPCPAEVVGRDLRVDLALIRLTSNFSTTTTPPPPLTIRNDETDPDVGTLAFAHGYPAGIRAGQPAMTSGIVSALADGVGWTTLNETEAALATSFVVTDAAMAGGMSGGPLVNDGGMVLGVNALVRPDLRALGNYAVSASECITFLDKVRQDMEEEANEGQHVSDSSSSDIEEAGARFRVVIYNDPMNTRARVAKVLNDVAKLDVETANSAMMKAHTTGRGVVKEFPSGGDGRDSAEELCDALREEDIMVEVERIPIETK